MFFCEFYENFKNIVLYRAPLVAASKLILMLKIFEAEPNLCDTYKKNGVHERYFCHVNITLVETASR